MLFVIAGSVGVCCINCIVVWWDDKVDNCPANTDVVIIIRNQQRHRCPKYTVKLSTFIGQTKIKCSSFQDKTYIHCLLFLFSWQMLKYQWQQTKPLISLNGSVIILWPLIHQSSADWWFSSDFMSSQELKMDKAQPPHLKNIGI